MLSRLTEISFPSYTTQDQAKVIDSILLQSKFNDDKSIQFFKNKLNTVYDILSKEKEQLSLSIPFTKIIEIVRIAISWRSLFIKNERQETEESLFSLALFRCATGSLPFNNKKLFIDTFYNETSGLSINDKLKEVLNEKTDEGIKPNDFLIIEEDQGLIRSSLSNIFIPSPLHKLPETNICFTPSLKDLIDVILSAASINYPLIIEGPNGTGKSSAFFYLSKCVDANVVRISISSSTTVEDLFGKYEPNTSSESLRFDFQPTNFLNAIKNKSSNNEIISDEFSPIKKQWIIIEELHLASASVLDSLAPVFNKQTYQLFLPDGTVVSKRDYFIVGLISQPLQNQSIIQTSMNYKTRDYTESEYKQIYKVILSNNNFNDEVCKYFTEKMLILSKLSSISQNKIPVTVREAYKFIKMFEGSQGQIEIEQLIKTLCLGRFANNEFFEEAKKELNYNDDNEKLPNISVEMGTSTLDSDGIPMHINLRSSKNYQLVQYLSSSEKELFVFLSMALKKYAPIVIQGPTSSGKTYSIQLFSDIVGKPLQIIQLNSEINSQTIAGTFQPSKNLSDSEMDELKEALLSISDLPNLTPEYSEKIKNDEIEKWKPSDFKNLRSHLLETKSQLDASDQEKVSQFIKKINSLLQFYNHLERKDSVIIKAMIEGSWLLLDGIECAPTDFFDRLSTLFDDYPLLNLYERGNGYIYSYNSLNPERRIHPDFRLIMTYNPIDVGSNNIFPSSLLSRCTIFSMKAIDNSISDSSIIIYGLLNQIEIDDINPVELSIKLGKIQMVAKEFTFNSQFSVTGRTIIHLCHNILYKSKDDNFNIKDIIKINYSSLMDDTSKFMEAVDEKFEQNVDINMIKNIKKAENASKTCSEIKYLINNFISEVKTNIDTKFDFITFLSLMLQLNLKDVESVYNTISYKLLNFLSQMIMKNFEDPNKKTDKLIDFVAHCSSIRCLQILVNELREVCQKCMGNFSEKNITLTSTQVQEKVQIQIVVKKIKCLLYLIQKNIFVMQAFPILFDDDARKDYLKLLNSNNKYQYHKFLSNEYVYLFVDDKTDIESISKKIISNYMPTNLISNIQKLASCLFFNDKNFEPLFSGIDKLFFISLETLLNDNSDIEVFTNLIDYIEIFKDIDFDTSLSIDDFKSIYNKYSNSDLEEFNIYYQHLRFVNNKSPFQNHSNIPKGLKVLKPIIDTVRSLYESYIEIYNHLFLQRQKDKNAAKAFIKLIENINNRLEKEKELRLPLELFTKLTINIEITTENFDFLNQIYLSIKTEKDKEIDRFIWPHPSQFKFSSETPPSYPLLDSLINYTKKEQIDLNSADWMTLCSIETNRECFLKEYLNKSISQELIIKYKAYLKAQLLYELSKIQDNDNEKYEYCSRNKIILFFNEISNRSIEINQTYVDLAHYYEMNMDKNFTICIPHFDFNDIVSLIINPIDKSPGPLFADNLDSIIQQDIDFLKCIKISLNSKPDKNFFLMITKKYLALNKVTNIDDFSLDQMHDYVISKFSIENHIQVMVQAFYDAYQISKIALSNEKNIKLLFDDIPIKVDEEFIDKKPSPGFYLTLYHDIIPEIENLFNLEDESSFPITLFNYRIYTNQSIIELKLPSSFSSQDAEGLIIEISKIIKNNINNGKITKFSNLLGFLLDQVPISLNTNKSEHVREIILDLLSKIQNPIITKYIMKYLNKYIESMINILGSEKWIDLLKSDCFNIQNENQFLMFLMNPWKKVFDYIKNDFDNDKKQIDEKIRKIMDNINFSKYNNRGFFNRILDAKIKDEKHLQNIIKEEYQANSNIENEIDSNINKLVMNYSKYLNSALNQIKEFPSVYKDKFQSSDFYMDFYKHLTENSGFNHPIFDTEITLIVIITKDKTKSKVNIKFKKKKQDFEVSGLVNTITILKLPKNTSILDLNLSSIEADIYYFTVFTSTSTGLAKQFKFKEMISCFNDYKKQLDLVLENNQDFKIGNIEVCFNNHKFESFKDKINDIDKEIKEITSISGSLKIYSSSTQKILSKIKEIEDYFPLNFVNRTEIPPKETNSSLEKFLNFISKSKQDLQEIEIPQEIIDADEEFIVNKSSSFQNILRISDRFAKKPRPNEGSPTKYTVDEFVRTCKNHDKLIIPTFFLTENDIVLNINHLSVKLGPFYKGTFYSDLKFRIINLTNNEIKCVFHQNDQIIDLKYENTDGFFYIVFPINQIKMDLNEDSEIKFTGKISFYSDNIEKPFKEIEYDITLLFLSTNIFIKLHKQSFAIKDGQAQIIPYFVTPRSNLSFRAIPYFRQIQLCELPDNTVSKPRFITNDNDIKIIFPSLDENENNYLSMQFDFGLTNDIPISIPLNVPISDPYFNVLIYDDKNKDFAKNSTVSIGNLWRDVYVLISYINMTDFTVTPSISFEKMNSDVFEIRLNESIVFKPYSQDARIMSFKARTIMLQKKKKNDNYTYNYTDNNNTDNYIDNSIEVRIGIENSKKVCFRLLLDKIYYQQKNEKIRTNRYLKSCSFYDESNKFTDYHLKKNYEFKKINYIISPISHYVYIDQNRLFVQYYKGYLANYPKDFEYEILYISLINNKELTACTNIYKDYCLQIEYQLRLFAKIKGYENSCFPLFGYRFDYVKEFDPSKTEQNTNNIKLYLEWCKQFFIDTKNSIPIYISNGVFCCNEYKLSNNIGYLIHYLTKNYKKLNYDGIIKSIQDFTNSKRIKKKYDSVVNKKTNIEWKLISLVWAIIDTIFYQYDNLTMRNFNLNLPISTETIIAEQKRLIEKSKIDRFSMLNTQEYSKILKKLDRISNDNKKCIDDYKNDGYSVSQFIKWTYEKNFETIPEEEFPKEDTHNKDYKEDIEIEFSNDSGNFEIQNVSFNNAKSLIDIYNAFDSILKNTYQLTISIYSSFINKKNQKQNIDIFNELVSFFMWAKDIQIYSPYSSFLNKFITAYQSMILRLQASGIKIRNDHYIKNDIFNKNNDFIEKPKIKKNIESLVWTRPGKQKMQVDDRKKKMKKKSYPHYTFNSIEQDDLLENDKNTVVTSFITEGKKNNSWSFRSEPIKQISTKTIHNNSKDSDEIPNQDYIDYIVNLMTNPSKVKEEIKLFNDDKSHIPMNYDIKVDSNDIEIVNNFFYAAENLSGSILNGLGMKSPVFNNIDNCYASILIDCSNTFSNIQKVSLILLTIAYGNALTALGIPYTIIIFCDDNFQFILKKLDDKHEKIHFLKLIESMTVKRRMSSITDAIQMAKLKIIPSGSYAKRTNHIIYTFSDGLSASLNSIKEWNSKILENKSVTVSFFFLNIISNEILIEIWSKFSTGILNSKSPTSVFYSTYDNILDNKEFFDVLSTPDDDEITKIISLSECFSRPIIQSIDQTEKEHSNIITPMLAKKLNSYDLDTNLLASIIEILCEECSDERKYFKETSNENIFDESFDFEIPSIKIDSFSVNITFNDSKGQNSYSLFCNDLYSLSTKTIDQSSAQEMSSLIFIPNKPSQYTPSSDGTLFYFPGLIRFLLTQGQDTKIFLEKKAGFTKSYSIFVVVDCSTSCFNIQSTFHAFQSIFVLLQTLSKIDIPSFNLIITTKKGPLILCLEKSTFDALSINSPIWVTLFSFMLNPHEETLIESALLTTLSIRMQQKTLSSVLFLFTDGNFSLKKQKICNSILDNISSYNVETITIGIGSLPHISSLSTKKVWSANPKNVVKALLAAFGKETNELIPNISSLFVNIPFDRMKLAQNLEYNSIEQYTLKELITELNSITRNISVFNDFYNFKSNGTEIISENSTHDLGIKNFYKGIKILICQFWDHTMSPNENENISKEVLINGVGNNKISVIKALYEFGITTLIVQNYYDAINKMKSGDYSEIWIICGRYDGKMPDNSDSANLLSQFIDALIMYWENGGGIVFWADNSPFCAEVNFFLSKAKFDNDEKVKFRIGGTYPGSKMLRKSKRLNNATFTSNEKIQCDGYYKFLFNTNMEKIYEGYTISSAIIPPKDSTNECYIETPKYRFASANDIRPFSAFSMSSSGGFSTLFYNSLLNSPKGDIVIDCGFSKLFFELTEENIYPYVRNIAIFMLSLEKKSSMIGGNADPRKVKPKKFDFNINKFVNPNPKYYSFNAKQTVDIVFLIDGTGSMEYLINAVINVCNDLANKCKLYSSNNIFRFGAVIYRDEAVGEIFCRINNLKERKNLVEFSNLSEDIYKLQNFLSKIETRGGGNDGPEDWVSGFKRLKKLNWEPYSEKLVIHIANAGAHGASFNCGDFSYPYFTSDEDYNKSEYDKMDQRQDKELPELINWAADKKIRFSCLCAGFSAKNSFEKAKRIYNKKKGPEYIYKMFNFNGENVDERQKREIFEVVKKISLESIDKFIAVDKDKGNKVKLLPQYTISSTNKDDVFYNDDDDDVDFDINDYQDFF